MSKKERQELEEMLKHANKKTREAILRALKH